MATKALAVSSNLLPLLMAALVGAWLLSTRFLSSYLVDSLPELSYMAFHWLALPAFIWSAVLSLIHLLRARPCEHRVLAVTPLVVNFLIAALFLVPTPFIDQMDFQRHYAARVEVVQRIESGELWNGSPFNKLVSLPWPEYPTSVSNDGWRDVDVYREDSVLHVVFHPTTGSVLDQPTAILYRADGEPPSLSNALLTRAVSFESLGDRWYRVHYARDGATNVALLVIVVTLTAASSVVVVPLVLGFGYLERRALMLSGPVRS